MFKKQILTSAVLITALTGCAVGATASGAASLDVAVESATYQTVNQVNQEKNAIMRSALKGWRTSLTAALSDVSSTSVSHSATNDFRAAQFAMKCEALNGSDEVIADTTVGSALAAIVNDTVTNGASTNVVDYWTRAAAFVVANPLWATDNAGEYTDKPGILAYAKFASPTQLADRLPAEFAGLDAATVAASNKLNENGTVPPATLVDGVATPGTTDDVIS